MSKNRLALLYVGSLVVHGVLAAAVSAIEPPPIVETVRITMREAPPPPPEVEPPPPPPEPEAPPPPPPEAPEPAPRPRAQEAPPPEAAPPPPAPTAAPLDFGVAMQGGVGLGGVSVPVGDVHSAPDAPRAEVVRTASARTLEAPEERAPRRAAQDDCQEEASRPRPLSMPQPAYTDDARAAQIEGRVRVRLEVDETGAVRSVEVVEGLGHGLDEAARAAVQEARFEPAMRCGSAVPATFTISVRFTL